mgnify:FL=1|jgi:hypothetical protein
MSLGKFTTKFGQGIRPNLYKVTGQFGTVTLSDDEALLIKAAAMPSASLGVVTIPFKGREVKRAGDRTFTDWTISVLCDDANTIHEKFIAWSEGFMGLGDTSRGLNYGEWTVAPLSVAAAASGGNGPIAEDENAGKTIQLVDCWPSEVGTIDFSYDSTDAVAEFSVTIGFDHWKFA